MEYSEIIHDFVEGTLDKGQEDQLFMLLNSNEDLREQLRETMLIESAMKSDAAGIAPSAAATAGVFSKLGYSIPQGGPASAPTPAPKPGFFSRLKGGFTGGSGGLGSMLMTSAITAVLTGIVIFLLINPVIYEGDTAGSSNTAAVENNVPVSESTEQPANAVKGDKLAATSDPSGQPETASGNAINAAAEQTTRTIIVKQNYNEYAVMNEKLDRILSAFSKENGSSGSNNIPAVSEIRSQSGTSPEFVLTSNSGAGYDPAMQQLSIEPDYSAPEVWENKGFGLNLEVSGGSFGNLTDPKLMPAYKPDFSNMSIAFYIPVSESFELGAEFRNEFFYQDYYSTNPDGLRINHYQNPNFNTLTFNARWNYLQWKSLSSFLQASLGGNAAGPVGRGMIGIEFQPVDSYSFFLGGELSGLYYYHNNNTFLAPKYGLIYGISFNF